MVYQFKSQLGLEFEQGAPYWVIGWGYDSKRLWACGLVGKDIIHRSSIRCNIKIVDVVMLIIAATHLKIDIVKEIKILTFLNFEQ